MIKTVHQCPHCGSENIVKNGTCHSTGKQKYRCKDCKKYGTLVKTLRFTEQDRQRVVKTYFERSSMRGVARSQGVSRPTLVKWLLEATEKAPEINETLAEPIPTDVLEADEVWGFVFKKYGVLCSKKRTNAGFGWCCAGVQGRLSLISSAIEAKRVVKPSIGGYLKIIANVSVTQTFGKPIVVFF